MSPPQILTTAMKNTVVDKNKDHARLQTTVDLFFTTMSTSYRTIVSVSDRLK